MNSTICKRDANSIVYTVADSVYSNTRWVSSIFVPTNFRRRGHGSDLMRLTCAIADDEQITLKLIPAHPRSKQDMPYDALVAWYKTFGFEFDRKSFTMIREPKILSFDFTFNRDLN